jgi:hypothetical protein
MELEGSLPSSQEPSSGPHHEPEQSSWKKKKTKQTNSMVWVRERTIPT